MNHAFVHDTPNNKPAEGMKLKVNRPPLPYSCILEESMHTFSKSTRIKQLRLFQAQSGSGGLVVSSDGKKREELRWFPANNISDCDAEPGLEQVKHTTRPLVGIRYHKVWFDTILV